MVVSFVTTDDLMQPEVVYWGPDMVAHRVIGTTNAYSQLAFIEHELVHPRMGVPGASSEEVLRIENTSAWARIGIYPFGRASNWRSPKKLDYHQLQLYSNPDAIYNSPIIATVTLPNLHASVTYGYRVSGLPSRNFSFTMPPASVAASPEAFPFAAGLTADLGQTVVSRANVDVRELD